MSASASTASFQEVQDRFGRTYRWGESPQALTGRPRWVYIVVPWIAMMLISTFEYGWGTAEDTLGQAYHWNLNSLSWLFTVWVVFESGSSFPTGWLRERGYLSARKAVTIGAVAVAVAFVSLTLSGSPWVAFIGWTIVGGTGAGMIYSSCINMASKWYPENKGLRTGFLNGGFAYGSVPFIYILGATFHLSDFKQVLIILGLGLGAGLLVCSRFFVDPPKNWWPPQVTRSSSGRRPNGSAVSSPTRTRRRCGSGPSSCPAALRSCTCCGSTCSRSWRSRCSASPTRCRSRRASAGESSPR